MAEAVSYIECDDDQFTVRDSLVVGVGIILDLSLLRDASALGSVSEGVF